MKIKISLVFLLIFCLDSNAVFPEIFESVPRAFRSFRHVTTSPAPLRYAKPLFSGKRFKSTQIGNPCMDDIFQYVFSNSRITSRFLNVVLGFKGNQEIQDVQLIKRDLPSNSPLLEVRYNFVVDLRCKTKDKRHFLVEMQNDFRDDYHMKALVEHSRLLSNLDLEESEALMKERSSQNKGDIKQFWKSIEGVYSIILTNKKFSPKNMKSFYKEEPFMEPDLVNTYELRHTRDIERHFGDTPNQITLVMLDHLSETIPELSNPLEHWLYAFKDSTLKGSVASVLVG